MAVTDKMTIECHYYPVYVVTAVNMDVFLLRAKSFVKLGAWYILEQNNLKPRHPPSVSTLKPRPPIYKLYLILYHPIRDYTSNGLYISAAFLRVDDAYTFGLHFINQLFPY